jgi:hypothetical protein
MGDRIKDLAVSVIIKNIAAPIWAFTDREFDEFIELIKSTCLEACESNYIGTIGSHASAHNAAVKKCVEKLKRTFEE